VFPSRVLWRALFSFVLLAVSAHGVTIAGAGSLTVSVDSGGSYEVLIPDLNWRFSGALGSQPANVVVSAGADSLGTFQEIAFDLQSGASRHLAIRSYTQRPAVLFTVNCLSPAPNSFSFPSLSGYPRNLDELSFSGTFAVPWFGNLASESPWIFFDPSANTFILSPAANFMTASTAWGPNGEMSSGIDAQIATLPKGFQHRTLLVIEKGINRAFDAWGHALTALGGKTRPANDADASLNQVGYWTDNGATYYYTMAAPLDYEQTLAAVKGDFSSMGIGLGSIQLDSWFYPKGATALWGNNGQGIYQYVAASPLFADGLANFQRNLGVPLITHARWIDASSPYRQLYQMSGNVVLDPAYWETTAAYLATSGVATYEQDWLGSSAQADFNLTDSDAFLDNMATAMAGRNLTMQYCMATPRHFLQTSKYSNLTTIRTSGDHLNCDRWTDFLYASRLASALGAWPFTDNLLSTQTSQILLATLSAGPVGLGDPIGSISAANLLRAVRRDGVIVKPDVPLTPTDASYGNMVHSVDTPQVASTYSDFGGLRGTYVFAFAHGTNMQVRISPADFGAETPVYAYDYFGGKGQVLGPADVLEQPITGDSLYLILAPLGPSGIAVLGDLDQFVALGKKRVSALTDDGTVQLTVAFAKGEASRTITGYSPMPPVVSAVEGAAGPVSWDRGTRLFHVVATPGPGSAAMLRIGSRTARPVRARAPR
jgi:hypothetical protein